MFWIFVASQLSLPVAQGLRFPDVRAVFTADDMPAYVQIEGISRFVATRTTISADGRPQECAVERASGDPKLDTYTCAIILKRAKFQPARWIDGSPVYAVLRAPVSWEIGEPASKSELQKAYPADMDLSVNQLPAGADGRASVSLILAVDENGRVIDCAERPPVSKNDHSKRFPELVPAACHQMISQFTAIPAKDQTGKAVRSVQNATVDVTAGPLVGSRR